MVRPKFISKAKREQQQQQGDKTTTTTTTTPSSAAATKTQDQQDVDLAAQRRAEADALVEEQIQKDLAARAAGKAHWDDSASEGSDAVDDTDDLDPAAEYAAWRLREIKRIVRAREAIEAKEREIAEKERRQNLTEQERAREDEALIAQQQQAKDARGKMGFMQKYYHKGAFYQDESEKRGLDKRDLMGARFADEIKNRELLPQALQMRDMTKLGKKGASKYRDLKSEDTGQWGRFEDPRRQRSEWDRYGDGDGGDERRRGPGAGAGDYGAKGANALPLGERKERKSGGGREEDNNDGGGGRGDSWRRERPGSRSRSRSRSRSPKRRDRDRDRHDHGHRDRDRDRDRGRASRKRSYSPERDRYGNDADDDDKRRKVG
ncbi:splicing factor, Prp19-binding domain-domain-containing protein [Coniella lustricola]|uniref:Splicing factor, Prp19-binding domain-domain-containing protein n=1 Tax=Coniella lustricola TaxID=2025994 RepID=A0A2T2ZTQ3_9PEZI|nr:splicing factor, Prp19-binding domain-domain-containing protein [Coniella lustricola]